MREYWTDFHTTWTPGPYPYREGNVEEHHELKNLDRNIRDIDSAVISQGHRIDNLRAECRTTRYRGIFKEIDEAVYRRQELEYSAKKKRDRKDEILAQIRERCDKWQREEDEKAKGEKAPEAT